VLSEKDEIRFDLIYSALGPRARIAMAIVFSVAIVVLYGASLKASFDYVTFMKVEKSSYLKIRMDWLYCIYLLFLVAIIARYLWLLWRLLRGADPEAGDVTKASPGP
jgi:TRAP-type C4-dicarboxylate transport system permease small subunit